MAYIIDNESYREIAGRKFLTKPSVDTFEHDAPRLPFVNHRVRNTYARNFGIIRFQADFLEDMQIRGMTSDPHISLHFQLKGFSNARFRDIPGDHPLRPAEYDIYYSENFHSDIFYNRQNGFEYLALILKKEHLLQFLQQNGNPASKLAHALESSQPVALFGKGAPVTPEMHSILHRILHPPVAEDLWEMYVNGKILELLGLQLHQHRNEHSPSHADRETTRQLAEVYDYLCSEFLSVDSVEAVAKHSPLSEHQIREGFRREYNTSVYELVHEKRMLHARQLLLDAGMSVEAVAEVAGYTTASNFIQAFKRKFGVTPKQMQLGRRR
ncbi:helix-turn-helix transcriptional regulator [Dyadobacter fermentans]|uniref:Transcriptional regulator, AraC family n=1 Tax=Dyadobacter fermentans (strain ATCC 700827 / DSM 18053 / CIP 107007 / KCTC 52180 / NS114) TaxID=471854 RepID=C6VYN6_DYAFD|nr:AraC family transcriptional regulator [Dyadobacter fermentans]ACT93391.1 transcriptional regulator, AraC family [Dyadobacter fermentans DSM 18053]